MRLFKSIIYILLLSFAGLAWGQSIAATATITDTDGQTWNNGSWSVKLNGTYYYNGALVPSATQSGSLSSSGTLAVTLYNTSTMTPSGSAQYIWIICSNTSATCNTFQTSVTTSNLSTLLSSNVTAPRFSAGATAYGYLDGEVSTTPATGQGYFNVVSLISRVWNGTAWQAGGDAAGAAAAVQQLYSAGNALAWACGVTINDGNVHTISTAPVGSCFNPSGTPINTLAGLAAITINGVQPFFFLTDSGAITGPMCTYGTTVNCFTATGTGSNSYVYNLTNASVANMDIAWLVIQALELRSKATLPAGTYVIGSTEVLPLMIPNVSDAEGSLPTGGVATGSSTTGEGRRVTILKAGHDFGANAALGINYPLGSCGDPSATVTNGRGRYQGNDGRCYGTIQNMTFFGPLSLPFCATGVACVTMDGFSWGARQTAIEISAEGFNNDWNIVGDHTTFINPIAYGGYIGFNFPQQNPILIGDNDMESLTSEGMSFAAIEVGAKNTISGVWNGTTYLSAPYGVDFATDSTCQTAISGLQIDDLFGEGIGNSQMFDETGLSGGVYTDANKCRNVNSLNIGRLDNNFGASVEITTGGRLARALWDIGPIQDSRIQDMQSTGQQWIPSYGTPVSVFNVTKVGNNGVGVGFRIEGTIGAVISSIGSTPLLTSGAGISYGVVEINEPGYFSGTMSLVTNVGSHTTSQVGDCLEGYLFSAVPCGSGYDQYPPVLGIVLQSGIPYGSSTAMVPIANSGNVLGNFGYSSIALSTQARRNTGIGGFTVVAGSGYTNGTYSTTATGGGCATEPVVSLVIASGAFNAASSSVTTVGVGCTSAPSIPNPSGIGSGTGGSITALWPSAQFATATGYYDAQGKPVGPIVTTNGTAAAGTSTGNIILQGLK